MLLVASMPASAHDPTPNRNGDGYSSSNRLRRVWSTANNPPSWVEDAVDLAIDHAPSSGANIPTFVSGASADGLPVLVYDQPDAENHYTLWATDGSGEPSLLWSSDQNHIDATSGDFGTSALVRTSQSQGVESPGFVPVFGHGVAYAYPDGPNWTSDQRVMIDMATGERFPFEAGELQP